MKWKLVICGLALFLTASCASMYAEKTEIELYRLDGSKLGKVFSNKSYDEFSCTMTIDPTTGIQNLTWTAAKINSDTVAAESFKATQILSGTISDLVKTTANLAGVIQ